MTILRYGFLFSDELKGKWKNMRDYYKKEVKRLEKCHPEGASSKQSQWSYFSQLSFLKDSIAAKEKETACLSCNGDESSDHLQQAKPETLEFDTEEIIEETEDLLTNPLTSVSHTIKRKLDDERKEPEPKKCFVTTESNEDEDLLFFKSLLPDFKSLSRDTRLLLKLEYMLLLHNKVNSKANAL